MLVTQHIFLDTTIFEQINHNYSSATFQRLATLVKEDRIKIYITNITQREIESRIKRHVETAQDNIKAALNNHRLLKNIQHPSIDAINKGIDVKEVTKALIKQFRDWLSEMSVTVLPTEHVSIEEIFDKYFACTPPFEAKKDKKAEFPDAFALAAVEGWCQKNSARMYVISNDGGMVAACESSRSLRPIRVLSEFIDMLTQGEKLAEIANKRFETHKPEIWQKVKLAAGHLNISSYEPHVQVEYSYITSVRLLKHYLIEVEETKAVFDVTALAAYTANVTRQNYAVGMMMGMPGLRKSGHKYGSKQFQAEVILSFDVSNLETCKVESVVIKYSDTYFDIGDDEAWLE